MTMCWYTDRIFNGLEGIRFGTIAIKSSETRKVSDTCSEHLILNSVMIKSNLKFLVFSSICLFTIIMTSEPLRTASKERVTSNLSVTNEEHHEKCFCNQSSNISVTNIHHMLATVN